VIVMRFGGSSVASATAVQWAAGIVKSHIAGQPVVVVSAMGKTTHQLVEAIQYVARGSAYSARHRLEELRRYHFQETQHRVFFRAIDPGIFASTPESERRLVVMTVMAVAETAKFSVDRLKNRVF